LRGRNNDGDQEDRSLGLFDKARYRQPIVPSESRREKKVVGKLLLEFDLEGNVNNVDRKKSHKALDDARKVWEKNKPKSEYSFTTFTVGGESAASEQTHPVHVTVKPGQPVLMTYAQSGEQVPADATANIPPSIEAILDRIHKDIDTNIASFDVEYYDNGVPRKVCETKILPHGRTDMDCTHISNVNALIV
jgi:hypothetical protein